MPAVAAWNPERSAAGTHSPWLIAAVVSIATFMEVLDTSIANVSLNHIAGGLSASYDESTWILTSYLVSNAIVIPISGWLSSVIGRKRYYMLSVALFSVSSLLCGLAPNLPLLIFFRVLQGIGGGGLAPSEQTILTDTFAPRQRGLAFSLYGLTVVFGPVVGPTLGGFITDNTSWRWIFLINLPVGILSLLLVNYFVTDPPLIKKEHAQRVRRGLKVDGFGFLLVALWLGCLEIVLDKGQREDWLQSNFICSFLAVSVIAGITLFIWEARRKDPIFDVRLMARGSFLISLAVMMVTGLILYGTTQIIPQFLQEVLDYTSTDAGLALTAGGLATIVMLPLAGKLTNVIAPKYLIAFGIAIEAIALWNLTHISGDLSFWGAAGDRVLQAMGLPFLFIPINTAAYATIPPDKTSEASGQLNLARNLGGSFGISIAQTVLAQRAQFHQARLVSAVSPYDLNTQAWLRALNSTLHTSAIDPVRGAWGALYQLVLRQAQVLAYIDTFWVMMLITAAVFPLVFFLKNGPKDGAAAVA